MTNGAILKVASTVDTAFDLSTAMAFLPGDKVYQKDTIHIEYLDGGHSCVWAKTDAPATVSIFDVDANTDIGFYEQTTVSGTLRPGQYAYRVVGVDANSMETDPVEVRFAIPEIHVMHAANVTTDPNTNHPSIQPGGFKSDVLIDTYECVLVDSSGSPADIRLVNRAISEVDVVKVLALSESNTVFTDAELNRTTDPLIWSFSHIIFQPATVKIDGNVINQILYFIDGNHIVFSKSLLDVLNADSVVTVSTTVDKYIQIGKALDFSLKNPIIYDPDIGELRFSGEHATIPIPSTSEKTNMYYTISDMLVDRVAGITTIYTQDDLNGLVMYPGLTQTQKPVQVGGNVRLYVFKKVGLYDFEHTNAGTVDFVFSGITSGDIVTQAYRAISPSGVIGIAARLRKDLSAIRVYKLFSDGIWKPIFDGAKILNGVPVDTIAYDTGQAPIAVTNAGKSSLDPPHVDSIYGVNSGNFAGIWAKFNRGESTIALSVT